MPASLQAADNTESQLHEGHTTRLFERQQYVKKVRPEVMATAYFVQPIWLGIHAYRAGGVSRADAQRYRSASYADGN